MTRKNALSWIIGVLSLAGLLAWAGTPSVGQSTAGSSLRTPADFVGIANLSQRSVALFAEASRVIESPRCQNCHPRDRTPTQGADRHPHVPFIMADSAGHGPPGLACATCHQTENVRTRGATIETVPGHPHWALAPASMAWQGKSIAEICEQIKDPARNGGRTLAQIHEHMAQDTLVGWAWRPGIGRPTAPGTQEAFGSLIEAWIATGAACPTN